MIDDDSLASDGSEPAVPANPRPPYGERPVARARRAKAQELIERLVAEGRVRITELLRVGHRSGDGLRSATSEAPELLIEMSDVSTTLLGGL
ncbi:hypothetical protein ACFWDT_29280, partial [Streptomyces diastaticus]